MAQLYGVSLYGTKSIRYCYGSRPHSSTWPPFLAMCLKQLTDTCNRVQPLLHSCYLLSGKIHLPKNCWCQHTLAMNHQWNKPALLPNTWQPFNLCNQQLIQPITLIIQVTISMLIWDKTLNGIKPLMCCNGGTKMQAFTQALMLLPTFASEFLQHWCNLNAGFGNGLLVLEFFEQKNAVNEYDAQLANYDWLHATHINFLFFSSLLVEYDHTNAVTYNMMIMIRDKMYYRTSLLHVDHRYSIIVIITVFIISQSQS